MKKTIFDLIMEIGNGRPVGIDGIVEIGNLNESEVQAVVAEMVADGTLKYSEYEENCVYIVADLKDEEPKKEIILTEKQQAVIDRVQEANDLGMTLEDTIVYQAEWAGISSASGVRRIMNRLVELGVLERYLTTEWSSKTLIADKVNMKVSKPIQDCDTAEELLKQLSDNDISTRALKIKTHHYSTPSYYKVKNLEKILGPAKFNIFKVALHRRKYISLYNYANHNASTTIPGGYLVVSVKGHESVGNKVPK